MLPLVRSLCRGLEGPVNDERRALDVSARHQAPVAAVVGVVAIVAHGENETRRHYQFTVHDVVFEHFRGSRPQRHIGRRGGEIVAVEIGVGGGVEGVGLVDGLAVEDEPLVHEVDVVAGHADGALDVILLDIERVAEHDDVAAPHVAIRQQVAGNRPRRRVDQLVHQQVIADQQRPHHGGARYDEGLHQRGGGEQQ